jgi:hypothetical protein
LPDCVHASEHSADEAVLDQLPEMARIDSGINGVATGEWLVER